MNEGDQLRQGWFDVRAFDDGVFGIAEPLHEEHVWSYLVVGDRRAVVIDTGMGVGDLRAVVEELTDRPISVVNSHAHWDHIGANWRFSEIAIHRAEADRLPLGASNKQLRDWFTPAQLSGPLPVGVDAATLTIPPSRATTILDGGERLDLGGRTLEVLHTPGHSPGGIVLLDRAIGALFSTDVAYAGQLYAFSDDVDLDDYRRSLRLLAALAPELRVLYPSHNDSPISPELLPPMADALDLVIAGRSPDEVDEMSAIHHFDGFAIRAAAATDV